MLSREATKRSIDRFLGSKMDRGSFLSEDDVQYYKRDVRGNVYHVGSLRDADSVVFRYRN